MPPTCCWAQQQKNVNDVLFTESLLAKKYEKTGRVWTCQYSGLQFLVKYIFPSLKNQSSWATLRCLSQERSFREIMICHVQCQKEAKQTRMQRQPWSWITLRTPWHQKKKKKHLYWHSRMKSGYSRLGMRGRWSQGARSIEIILPRN